MALWRNYHSIIGELRQVSSVEKRVNEARRMGFSRIIVPKQSNNRKKLKHKRYGGGNTKASTGVVKYTGIDCIEAENVMIAIEHGLVSRIPKYKKKQYNDKSKTIIDDDEHDDWA
jgi:hypothetical protein